MDKPAQIRTFSRTIERAILLAVLCGVLMPSLSKAQTFAYTDQNMLWSHMACHVDGGVVRKGPDWRGEITYTVSRDKIFHGYSSSTFDLAYTYRDGKLYIGDSYFTDAISYTFYDGQIFVGHSTFPLDLAYTLRPSNMRPDVFCIYRENSISPFDIVAFMHGEPTEIELFALLLTMALL